VGNKRLERGEQKRREIRLSELIAPVFLPIAQAVRDEAYGHIWMKGGRGSGKSSAAAIMIALGMLRDASASAICLRQNANTLADSVYMKMAWALGMLGWDGDAWTFRRAPLEILNERTGQRILFRGLDDPLKLKSTGLARGYMRFCWFEELSEFRGMEDIRSALQSTARGTDHFTALYTYNPPREAGSWVNAEALRPVKDRLLHESCYLDMPPEWLGKRFLADADASKSGDERAYRHEYLGEITGFGGQVFDNLRLRRITAEDERAFGYTYCGLDFGFAADPDALIRAGYDTKSGRLAILDEYYGSRTPADVLTERIKAICGRAPVACDSAEPRMIDTLRRGGVQAYAVKKGAGSVEAGIRWLMDRAEIACDPARTPNAAREMSGYAFERDRSGNYLGRFPDKDNHAIDALRYAMIPLLQPSRLRICGNETRCWKRRTLY
jgi:PBSX family phage terminase large subunit